MAKRMQKRSNKKPLSHFIFLAYFFQFSVCKLYVVIIKETKVLTATIKEGTLYIYKLALYILLLNILHIFFLLFVRFSLNCVFLIILPRSHVPLANPP